jgi:serine/threonine-protein kinase HipA
MSKNNLIDLYAFGEEIGKIGYDEDSGKSYFQYNPVFLKSGRYSNLFPLIIKRAAQPQVFSQYNNPYFRGLPPAIADSLPDVFGNLIFKTWMESSHKDFEKLSILEQLAYVSNRGMGALEYKPGKAIPSNTTINIGEITEVLKQVLDNKNETQAKDLSTASLLNIFKIGTSAGGARPKILISENKTTGQIIPGDLEYSADYNHYLVKLSLDDEKGFNSEIIEYCYYLTARHLGITMMDSTLLEGKHFSTLRYDRQGGKKNHVLTASGMTGWTFSGDPGNSSYENLFELSSYLKLPFGEIDELFRRMIFNVVFFNSDDHLKNHSFIYDEVSDKWHLAPAYDLTYSLNPLINYTKTSRALSINGKRTNILLQDLISLADRYTIKNPKGILEKTQQAIAFWTKNARELNIAEKVVSNIMKDFTTYEL